MTEKSEFRSIHSLVESNSKAKRHTAHCVRKVDFSGTVGHMKQDSVPLKKIQKIPHTRIKH